MSLPSASAPGQAAPPAPEDWFSRVDHCWCGGRPREVSPCSESYFVCERCGTHVSQRRLHAHRVADFYSMEGYWHARQREKAHPTLLERRSVLERDGRVDRWVESIEAHTGKPAGSVVVEVGCAEGTLLSRLQSKGWIPCGVEPDPSTATAVSRATGLDIRAGTFPGVAVPACDLFVACDVLEHALDPQGFLLAAWQALRPGGTLFLQLPLMVPGEPDFGGITPKVFDPWEHAFIFSRDSVATLLAATGFTVLSNDRSWIRAHEFVVARKNPALPRVHRYIANLPEMFSAPWRDFMDELNRFAAPLGLREFRTWSKIWEYPALWRAGLDSIDWNRSRLLDIGSELSALPWWLASRGARVTLIETSENFVEHWKFVREKLGLHDRVDWHIVQSSDLPVADGSIDVVTSLSVIEHQPDKVRAVDEVARVLRPGGLFALSFDLAEPELGMTYPAWNGEALTRAKFEALLGHHDTLELTTPLDWNHEDIAAFAAWHRQTAPHHTYVTGAAVLRRVPHGWPTLRRRLRHAYSRLKARFAR
ncbi:MAG TPA: methyltransferase domain-containing protein [Opitutaceae bacterium]|nr:methyltransferase domain-containing protein [Opitutaceae bacterium]